jgi:TonB family protein
MKISILFFFHLIFFCSYGQTINDTIWYTSQWKRTTYHKVKAIYGIKDYDETGRGLATYYYKNGTLHSHQNEYKDLKDGLCIWYHSNGKKSTEANYVNDTLHGELRSFNEKEQLQYVKKYEMGIFKSKTSYDLETGEEINISQGIIEFPDVEAEFQGGMVGLQNFISQNVQYPKESIINNEQGKVYLSFIIEPDGSISTIVVERGVYQLLNEEAIRVIQSMPKWIPGEANGTKVRTRVRLPINFTLTTGNEGKKGKKRK